jgi:predicted metal-dependent phosphoesterase TrpH
MSVAAPTVATSEQGREGEERERTGRGDRPPRVFADFHIHTRYSRDSVLDEETFIRAAMDRGLTHVAVTNHNNVEGAVAVREAAQRMGVDDRLTVILGEEVSTADGEVVGIFLERTIPRGLSAEETADEIHAQGGLVSIPHPFDPFRGSHIAEVPLTRLADAGKIDAVEVFNSRVTFQRHNQRAAELAARYGIPGIACSDSHAGYEVAMSFNALPPFADAAQLKAVLPENEWHGSRSTMFVHLTTRYAVWSKVVRRWLGRELPTPGLSQPGPPSDDA